MDPTQPYPLGPASAVDPDAIERGLADLWKSAHSDEAESAVIRSCTLNLAVMLSDDDRLANVTESVAGLTQQHPCRLFLVAADPHAADSSLEAWVSALCHVPAPGQQSICCEQVSVVAKGDAVNGLPNLLLSLRVPDLPFVVWWRGRPPLDTPLFARLSTLADRVVVDSAAGVAGADFVRLAALLDARAPTALADLAWNRLTCWRSLVAQCFDAQQQRPYLERLDRVTLAVQGDPTAAEALLALGWLASRLGWVPASGRRDGMRNIYTFTGTSEVQAEVKAHSGQEPYFLQRVALGVSRAPQASFVIERQDVHTVRVSVTAEERAPLTRMVPVEIQPAPVLLSDELDRVGHDQVYEEALAVAGRMATLLGA